MKFSEIELALSKTWPGINFNLLIWRNQNYFGIQKTMAASIALAKLVCANNRQTDDVLAGSLDLSLVTQF